MLSNIYPLVECVFFAAPLAAEGYDKKGGLM